jgi:hypothetical protein
VKPLDPYVDAIPPHLFHNFHWFGIDQGDENNFHPAREVFYGIEKANSTPVRGWIRKKMSDK